MSDIEREEFEQAVADKWSDSYSFTRFGDEDYYDEVLEGTWRGWQARRQALEGEAAAKKAEDERQQEAEQQALKQKQAEQNKRLAAEAETAKAEMASREQYDEGQKAAKQPAPVAAKAAQSTPVNKGAHPERPSTAEIISVLASHYGVDTGVVALWILELKVQEAA